MISKMKEGTQQEKAEFCQQAFERALMKNPHKSDSSLLSSIRFLEQKVGLHTSLFPDQQENRNVQKPNSESQPDSMNKPITIQQTPEINQETTAKVQKNQKKVRNNFNLYFVWKFQDFHYY